MATPGKASRDFPLRVTKAGAEAIDTEADALGLEKVEIIRIALKEYFERRGRSIRFTPDKPGGKQARMTEKQTVEQVLARIRQLGLPQPVQEHKFGHKTYDLAWPDQQVALEVSRRKRPADTNEWTVGHIKPTMGSRQIDAVLKALLN